MTLVCVPILVHDVELALRDARDAKAGGADCVEFRVDELFTGDDVASDEPASRFEIRQIERLVAESCLPCIVTCRIVAEGGGYAGGEDARIALYEHVGLSKAGGARYLDIELASLQRSANLRQKVRLAVQHPTQLRGDVTTSLIVSTHDFQGLPADLMRRVDAMQAEPAASVLKVACRARNLHDALELLELPLHSEKPTIALAMGEFGTMSRILTPKFGGFLTFASLRTTTATAPGQPTLSQLLEEYRFRTITPRTRVYGVVGYPIDHSRSPLVHNAAFGLAGMDAVYVPLPIAAYTNDAEASYASFRATMLELVEHPKLDLCGCSVTMPHKEHLVRLAREQAWSLDASSHALGAANTLVVDRSGRGGISARVLNTDVPGVASALTSRVASLAGTRVAIIGAGGAAKAAAFAVLEAGGSVEIAARQLDRAEKMAQSLRASAPSGAAWQVHAKGLKSWVGEGVDAIVHCTPAGMHGSEYASECVVSLDRVAGKPVVMDTVYNPIETPLLHAARAQGLPTIDGVTMFVEQAARQAEAWLTRPVDGIALRASMDAKVRASLAGDKPSPTARPA